MTDQPPAQVDVEALLKFAAAIARGAYTPSHCVEDYRKGTGREAFAAMCVEYADRLNAKVHLIKQAAAEIGAWRECMDGPLAVKMQRLERENASLAAEVEKLEAELKETVECNIDMTQDSKRLMDERDAARAEAETFRCADHATWKASCIGCAEEQGEGLSDDCRRIADALALVREKLVQGLRVYDWGCVHSAVEEIDAALAAAAAQGGEG